MARPLSSSFVRRLQHLKPLKERLAPQPEFSAFMAELGWDWPIDVEVDFKGVADSLNTMQKSLDEIRFDKSYSDQVAKFKSLLDSIKDVISSINNLSAQFPSPLPSSVPSDFVSR